MAGSNSSDASQLIGQPHQKVLLLKDIISYYSIFLLSDDKEASSCAPEELGEKAIKRGKQHEKKRQEKKRKEE